jgi:hypothetical protein
MSRTDDKLALSSDTIRCPTRSSREAWVGDGSAVCRYHRSILEFWHKTIGAGSCAVLCQNLAGILPRKRRPTATASSQMPTVDPGPVPVGPYRIMVPFDLEKGRIEILWNFSTKVR